MSTTTDDLFERLEDAASQALMDANNAGKVAHMPGIHMQSIKSAGELGQAIIALRRHVEAPQWQPIETAPKDGTAILLGSRGGAWVGKWLPVYVSGYRPDNPWSSLMLNHDHMGEKRCKPTHWMPLPAAPRR